MSLEAKRHFVTEMSLNQNSHAVKLCCDEMKFTKQMFALLHLPKLLSFPWGWGVATSALHTIYFPWNELV